MGKIIALPSDASDDYITIYELDAFGDDGTWQPPAPTPLMATVALSEVLLSDDQPIHGLMTIL